MTDVMAAMAAPPPTGLHGAAPDTTTAAAPTYNHHSSVTTMDTILHRVCETQRALGTGACTVKQAVAVWSAACLLAEEAMLKRQVLVLPAFASVGVQKEVEHMGGIWSAKVAFLPYVALAPGFVAQYCSDRPGFHGPGQTQHGSAVPLLMNGAALSLHSGLPRHLAVQILKDIIRGIGHAIMGGKGFPKAPVSVEMGCCILEFPLGARTYAVKWSRTFLQEFAAAVQVDPNSTTGGLSPRSPRAHPQAQDAAGQNQRATVAAAVQTSVIPAPPPAGAGTATVGSKPVPSKPPATAVNVPAPPPRPSSARAGPAVAGRAIPAPPPTGRLNAAARPATANAAAVRPQPAETPSLPSASPSPSRSQSRCHSASSSRPSTPRTNTLPRNADELQATIDHIHQSKLSPYHKRKAHKTAVRRARRQAFEDSWHQQKILADAKRDQDAAEERRRVEYFRKSLAEQAALEHNARLAKRGEAREIQELNVALAHRRDELQIPKIMPAGDLFSAREPPRGNILHTREILLHQMQDKRERQEAEKRADRAYQRHLMKEREEWLQQQERTRLEKLHQQQLLHDAYQQQVELKREEEERYKATMPKAGCILYSEDKSQADEARERLEVKLRSREFQDENRRFVEEKEARERVENAANDKRKAEMRREQAREYAADRKRETLATRERQRNLAGALQQQMFEKRESTIHDKALLGSWRDVTFLKNESSDDEGF